MWRRLAWLVSAAPLVAPSSGAGDLSLSAYTTVDISALGFSAVGGAALDHATGLLWVSDASGISGGTNDIALIDPMSGAIVLQFDASVVPGLERGPDALAVRPGNGHVFCFSSFGEDAAAELSPSGALVKKFFTTYQSTAAAFLTTDDLFLVRDVSPPEIVRFNLFNGMLTSTVAMVGYSKRVSAADFDPVTSNLFVYADETNELLEVDIFSGAVIGATDLSSFILSSAFPTGFAFSPDGRFVYLARGNGIGAMTLIVLSRCAGTVTSYGVGCAGLGGFVPELVIGGCPAAGETIAVSLTKGLGGSLAFFVVGLLPLNAPIGGGCFLNVAPLAGLGLQPVPLGGSGAGTGSFFIPAVVPAAVSGANVYLQGFVLDVNSQSPLFVSATNALAIDIP